MREGVAASSLISISDLTDHEIDQILKEAKSSVSLDETRLKDRLLINFFFEESTRTRLSFEIAAKRMGVNVINLQSSASSVQKGEDFCGSVETILQYEPDYLVIRHPESGILKLLDSIDREDLAGVSIINAGDGKREHPTQALGDALTIMERKGRIEGLIVVLCGDIRNSRVAGSTIALLKRMGAILRIVTSPASMLDRNITGGIPVFYNMKEGLIDADVIMSMRYKKEYEGDLDESKLYSHYKLSYDSISVAKNDVMIMHPGPVIKDFDIETRLYKDRNFSAVLDQVKNCLLVRRAILKLLK